jgi:RimJ/RimL family protein N-acetyltransferase
VCPVSRLGPVHILETERLVLRHLQTADLESLYALYRDPEIRRYFPDGTRTLEETKEELEVFLHGHPKRPELGLWATIEKSSGAFLGRCGLLPWRIDGRDEVELAYLIDKSRWGEGLATEAARGIVEHASRVLGLARLICLITPGNERSVAIARKVGMRFEREHTDEYGLCRQASASFLSRASKPSAIAPALPLSLWT